MAACVLVNTDGTLTASAESLADCSGFILLDAADYALMVQSYGITAEEVLYVFSWGFGAVIFFWSLGYAVGVARQIINRA